MIEIKNLSSVVASGETARVVVAIEDIQA